jgi:hypothetical protein
LAEVFKLVRAGVDLTVVKNYIANSASPFNLDAEKIIALSDAGVPVDIINAMMAHDKNVSPVVATTTVSPAPETAPPVEPVTVNYFYSNLSPYGTWVELEGYGRCWRPTVVVYDSSWSPYCDRGRWVYTDCGWYWDSDYSWGVTFHYGRWFRHDRFGWCWYPDTVWAPSWVVWRSSDTHCGWAPLPPFAEFRPGYGFYYRGASVAVGFDFGLRADCFVFLSVNRMCERHPRYYRESHEHVTRIYNQTTIINNYNVNSTSRTVVNNGIPVERVRTAASQPIRQVAVAELPNATRQGWRGNSSHSGQRPGNDDGRPARGGQNNQVTPSTTTGSNVRQPAAPARPANEYSPQRPPTTRPDTNRGNQGQRDSGNRNNSIVTPPITPRGNNNPTVVPSSSYERPQTPAVRPADRTPTLPPRGTPPTSSRQWEQSSGNNVQQRPAPSAPAREYYPPVAPATSEHRQSREQPRSVPVQPRQSVSESTPRNNSSHQSQSQSTGSQSGNRDRSKDQGGR